MKWMTLIAIVCGYLWTDAAVANEQKMRVCLETVEVAVQARKLTDYQLELTLDMIDAMDEDEEIKEVQRKFVRWGAYYRGNSERLLRQNFHRACMESLTGPFGMAEPNVR